MCSERSWRREPISVRTLSLGLVPVAEGVVLGGEGQHPPTHRRRKRQSPTSPISTVPRLPISPAGGGALVFTGAGSLRATAETDPCGSSAMIALLLRSRPAPIRGDRKPPLFTTMSRHRNRIGLKVTYRDQDLRSEEHTSELQSLTNLVCRLLLEKKKQKKQS